MKTRPYFLWLVILLLLSACEPASTPAADTATPSRTNILPSNTPTIRSQRTQTDTPIRDTPIPFVQTAMAIQRDFDCGFSGRLESLSPDGRWLLCDGPSVVMNKDGYAWAINWMDLLGMDWYGYAWATHWTQDGKYLYFALMQGQDGIRPSPTNAIALYRMDLANGEISTVLPPISVERLSGYVISIAPTGRRLAYIPPGHVYNQVVIKILDMRSSEESEISLDSFWTDAGWFSWSADGLELTVTALALGTGYYRLTYDVRTLELIDSQAFIPSWMQEYQRALQIGTVSPTP